MIESQTEIKTAQQYADEAEARRLEHESRINETVAKKRAEADAVNAENHTQKVAEISAQNDAFRESIKPRV
jgi:hypothetical protein